MKKAVLFTAVVFLLSSSIWAQINLVFENKSSKVNDEIAQQIKEAYLNLKNGDELLISVLSSKELKKLEDQDKIGFSRSRSNKIINYCTNSLTIQPLNIKYVFTPLASPKKVISSINKAYRNFTNRSGIYNLVIYRADTYTHSGIADTSWLKSKITTIKKSEEEYIYSEFVKIGIPENSFDCSCEKIEFEMNEEQFNEIDKIFITTNKLGCINADKFIESEENTNLIVKMNTTSPRLCARLIFKNNKKTLPGYFTNHDKTVLEFNKIPNGKNQVF